MRAPRITVRSRLFDSPLVGAHVSTRGGVHQAPARAAAIGATALQIFTKTPNQWREPALDEITIREFKNELVRTGMRSAIAHDSYLINLASPDPALSARSITSFIAELRRSHALGLDAVVSHPGNYIDDAARGLKRNAAGYTRCLRRVQGNVMLYIEATAGTGTSLGSRFEELAELRALIGADVRDRVGFCIDTCHLYSAGYDLVSDYDGVWAEFDRVVGLEHLKCFHLNDSKTPFRSRRDRHELIGEGTLGAEPFRRIMKDARFAGIPKLIETPKGDDEVTLDRKTIRKLKRYAGG
ncbi:MAG: deoxyribonuclease IV [Gemmatimonadota bacterium]